MVNIYAKRLGVLGVLAAVSLTGPTAFANVISVAGFMFHRADGLLGIQDTHDGQGTNVLPSPFQVIGELAFYSSKDVTLSVVCSSPSNFQAVLTDIFGNVSWAGATKNCPSGSEAWRSLDLGTPPLTGATALSIRGLLGPNETIGLAYQ